MATVSSPPCTRRGMSEYFWASSRGTNCTAARSIRSSCRSTKGTSSPLLEREHEVVLGDVAVFHEQVAQAAALFLLEREGLVQFFWGQESGLDQDLSQR